MTLQDSGRKKTGPKQVSSLAAKLVDPLLAKRVGMTSALMGAWPTIAGVEIADQSRPLKIKWPQRALDGEFQPGQLIIAAHPMAALHLQHETSLIIERVNAFFGYTAIKSVRIEQRAEGIAKKPAPAAKPPLSEAEKKRIDGAVAPVENERLQKALKAIGANILRDKR
ncbi:MAG: DciA family protein [Pseudomonadota bacterium]